MHRSISNWCLHLNAFYVKVSITHLYNAFRTRKGINDASLRCFMDHVKASITPHLCDALQMEEVSIFANSFGPTIKFTCEMSSERAVFLDTEVVNRPRLSTLRILDSQTHFKPTGTFHYAQDPATHSIRKMVLSKEKHYVL